MSDLPSEAVGQMGIHKAGLFFIGRGHIYREQPVADHGIDAHVEFRDGDRVTGRMIALQVKAGDGVFQRAADGTWAFYPSESKIRYWLDHSLPVYVVFWHETTDELRAVEVTEENLVSAGSGHKLVFGDDQRLDDAAIARMQHRARGTEYDLRLAALRLSLSFRDGIPEDEALTVSVQHWHADGSNLCQVTVQRAGVVGFDADVARWNAQVPAELVPTFLREVFVWADIAINVDQYWREQQDDWSSHLYEHDLTEEDLPYQQWWDAQPADRPYAIDDEVSNWSFTLTPNALAGAWRVVDEYASKS